MNSIVKYLLLRLGWKLPYIRFLSSRRTVILLYHGIPKESDGNSIDGLVFEQQVAFLRQHFKIVSPNELWNRREAHENIRVMLTFDDGFRNHAEVVAPILRKYNVPAIFFASSRHSIPGNYLWFTYLQALESHFPDKGFYFREDFFDMSLGQRHSSIQHLEECLLNLEPHPSAMYEAIEEELPRLESFVSAGKLADCYAGMTAEQVGQLSQDPLFSIGVHTTDHPFLTRCEPAEALRQIQDNKSWIEQASNKQVDVIAYPGGNYNSEVLRQSKELGFAQGYAVIPVLRINPVHELPRIGVYSKSFDVLGFKVQWGNLVRELRLNVG
jgi:peptidoglycan/xylan/chitin deacetylase (PgdA/CDA1 family)